MREGAGACGSPTSRMTPSRLRRDAPTQTGAAVRNPGPFTVPDTAVMTCQDPAGDHAHDPSHPASAEGAKAWQMVRPWGTIFAQVVQTPSRWVALRFLLPWPPLRAGVIFQWASTMPW